MPSDHDLHKFLRFHNRLNPQLWAGHRLRPVIRAKLFQDALAFYHFLAVPHLHVNDIILTGSNAAFNYTDLSDIDIHLLVDFHKNVCPELADNLFTTKKALWGRTYDAQVRGHAVEFYVEDTANPVTANGIYSILHGKWLKHPHAVPPHIDDSAVMQKTQAYIDEIDSLITNVFDPNDIERLLHRLHLLRQNGLMAGGEFSTENLTYKMLRNLGYLQKLYDARIDAQDEKLSLQN